MAKEVMNTMSDKKDSKKAPIQKIRFGGISISVWRNQGKSSDGKSFDFLTCTVQRSYKKDDSWENESMNARISDLPKIALACQEAYKFALTKSESSEEE